MKIDFCNAFLAFAFVIVAVCEEAILIFDTRDDLFGRVGFPFRYFVFVRTIIRILLGQTTPRKQKAHTKKNTLLH